MLEQLDALRALHEAGTTRRAAVALRVSQSAISKRIAALEARIGVALVEPDGRRVRVTGAGLALLDEVLPHVQAIDALLRVHVVSDLRIAATESLLGSWLPAALSRALAALSAPPPLVLHAHRGPLALERLRAAEVDLAVVVTSGEDGLHVAPMGAEPMVYIRGGGRVLWMIEAGSLTGAWLERRGWGGHHDAPRAPPSVVDRPYAQTLARIESYSSAIQLARAGLGDALVPAGLARAYGVDGEPTTLARPIAVVVRPSAWERPVVRRFVHALVAEGEASITALGPALACDDPAATGGGTPTDPRASR